MKKKEVRLIILVLVIIILICINIEAQEEEEPGSMGDSAAQTDTLSQDSVIENINNNQDFTGIAPQGAPIDINGVKFAPGEKIEFKDGKVNGKGTPKEFTEPIQLKGATLIDGKISEAEEIITSQGTFKNVKGVTEENGVVKVQEADNIEKPFPETQEQQPITQTTETQQPSIQNQQTIQQDPSQIPAQILQTQAEGAYGITSSDNSQIFETIRKLTAKFASGSTETLINGQDVEVTSSTISSKQIDSIQTPDTTLVGVHDFRQSTVEKITAKQVDQIIIQDKIINNVKDVTVITKNDYIYIKATSTIDNNHFSFPQDLRILGSKLNMKFDKDETFEYKFTKSTYNNEPRKAILLKQDEGVTTTFTYNNKEYLTLTTNPGGNILIIDNPTPYIELTNANLNYTNAKGTEEINTIGTSVTEMDINLGLGYVILAPVSSPGGRYTYEDNNQKEASFGIYNPSKEPYEVGFKKTNDFFNRTRFNKIKSGNSWGYADFIDGSFQYNGEVHFLAYRNKQTTETYDDYRLLSSQTMKPLYEGKEYDTAYINYTNGFIIMAINSKKPDTISRSGIFEIHENNNDRLLNTNFDLIYPDRILNYNSLEFSFPITIINETMILHSLPYKIYFHKDTSPLAREFVKDTFKIQSYQDYIYENVWKK